MYKKISVCIVVLSLFVLPSFVFAQNTNTVDSTTISATIPNPFKGGNDLMSFITTILSNVVMPIAAVAVVVWIVWAGFTFVTAQGKPAEIQKAQQRLLWSLIGAGILLGATAIAEVVKNTVKGLLN